MHAREIRQGCGGEGTNTCFVNQEQRVGPRWREGKGVPVEICNKKSFVCKQKHSQD